jgi:dihydroneopterin aldolase
VRSTTTLFVSGLEIDAEIGVYPHERGRTQPLVVDLEAELTAIEVNSLSQTLDHNMVAEACRRLARAHIDLVETFAEQLAKSFLEYPQVRRVVVRIHKPTAIPGASAAGVEYCAAR